MPECKYATAAKGTNLTGNPTQQANQLGIGERTIRRHNAKQCVCYGIHQPSSNKTRNIPKPAKTPNKPNTTTGGDDLEGGLIELGPEGGEFTEIKTREPLTNWDHIFERFNLDPKEFLIADDTVRMSNWQQSKALEDGTRDVVNLYSYRARFARKAETGINYADLSNQVRNWEPVSTTKGDSPTTYVVSLADWQLGKGEADGTPGTVERIKASLANILDDIRGMQKRGSLPRSLLLANMGDHIENVYSSYANQAFTTDLNVREQINLALELNLLWIKSLAPYFEEVTYSACLCNHGQLSRNGGKTNVSDDADNATGLIGDTLQTLCALHPELEHVQFEIPHDEMLTLVTTNGVNIAMGHGHKISGNEAAWLAKQAQNLAHRRNFHVDIWLLAHKHHASLIDLGPYTRIQATTNDPGSKYFEDMSGMYSRTGTTVFVSGKQLPGFWDHYRIH